MGKFGKYTFIIGLFSGITIGLYFATILVWLFF